MSILPALACFLIFGSLDSLILLFTKDQLISAPSFVKFLLHSLLIYGWWGLVMGAISGLFLMVVSRLMGRLLKNRTFMEFAVFVSIGNLLCFVGLLKMNQIWITRGSITTTQKMLPGLVVAIACAAVSFAFFLLYRLLGKWIRLGKRSVIALLVLYIVTILLSTLFGTADHQKYRADRLSRLSEQNNLPNVVIITIDTLRADYLACYGNLVVKTPNIDGVAKEGTLFSQTVAPIPITGPSHVSLMTSMYPRTHGIRTNGVAFQGNGNTLAELLRDRGYATAAFISAFPLKAYSVGLSKGFDVYDDSFSFLDSHSELLIVRFFDRLGLVYGGLARRAEATTQKALDWLERKENPPFFLWIHYFDPHSPYDPPPPYDAVYQGTMGTGEVGRRRALYGGEITYTDQNIGTVVKHLKELALYENTIFIITADHGESLGEHEYYYDHTEYLYEQLVRIPLIVRYPPLFPAGEVIQKQAQVIDITPTVLAITGVDAKQMLYGQNLLSLLNGDSEGTRPNYALLSTYAPEASTDRTAIRTNEWKLIMAQDGEIELYDLESDPGELQNRWGTGHSAGLDLKQKLQELQDVIPQVTSDEEQAIDPDRLEKLKSLGYF
ncbi:sulfatase-like hydrolase/transferase [Acidobacteriota bacterium]